jgi:hypothetical protein
MKELRVYVINASDCKTTFCFPKLYNAKKFEAIKTEAERLGTVYSLHGFMEAINNEDLNLSNSFIYITEVDLTTGTEKKEKRYEELYEKAVRRYLDKTDWDISEWLTKKEYKEFKYLQENN